MFIVIGASLCSLYLEPNSIDTSLVVDHLWEGVKYAYKLPLCDSRLAREEQTFVSMQKRFERFGICRLLNPESLQNTTRKEIRQPSPHNKLRSEMLEYPYCGGSRLGKVQME